MYRNFLHIVLFLLILTGCSGGGQSQSESNQNNPVIVTFWHAMSGPLGQVLEKLITEFNQANPDIKIEPVSMGSYPPLNQKLMAAVAAGQPPVMAQAYESWTMQFATGGQLTPMSQFIEGPNGFDKAMFDDLLPVFVEGNTFNGKMWSFPFNKSVRALYYNKTMFRELGLEKPPQTWEEYLSFSEKLTRDTDGDGKSDIYGTASQINAWFFENLLIQNDGHLLNPEGTGVSFHLQPGIEAMDFMAKLIGHNSKVGYLTAGYEYQNDFLASKLGMMEGSTVTTTFIAGKYDFELGIAPIPAHKKKACVISGTNIVIFSKVTQQQQDAAWRFIKWFTSTPITARWAAEAGYVPVRRSAFETETLKTLFEKTPDLRAVFEQLDYAHYEPTSPAWFSGRKYLEENAIQAVLKGLEDSKTALEKAAADTEAELKRFATQ